jgi:hypothetical protein
MAAIAAQAKQLAEVQAALAAKPMMAHLVLSSNPNGAMVQRGGSLLCTTPCDLDVTVGEPNETLTLNLDGYKAYPLKVSLVHGATVALALNLTKNPVRSRMRRGPPKAKAAPSVAPVAAPTPVTKPRLPALPGFRKNKAKKVRPSLPGFRR